MTIDNKITYEKLLKFSKENLAIIAMDLLFHIENIDHESYEDININLLSQYKGLENMEERLYIIDCIRRIEKYLTADYEDETGFIDDYLIEEAHEFALSIYNTHNGSPKTKYSTLLKKVNRLLYILDTYTDRSEYLKTYFWNEAYKDNYYQKDYKESLINF